MVSVIRNTHLKRCLEVGVKRQVRKLSSLRAQTRDNFAVINQNQNGQSEVDIWKKSMFGSDSTSELQQTFGVANKPEHAPVLNKNHKHLEDDSQFQLTGSSVNEKILNTEYAVRGKVLMRALEIEEELKHKSTAYPFPDVIKCNIGNPQALLQKPITFTRQVLSLVMNPDLLKENAIKELYPVDVITRAEAYIDAAKSVGAYSESNGIQLVRQEVSEFIERRDSMYVNPEDVFLTSGASEGVEHLMRILLRSNDDAILTPIPQYPLYSALTTAMDGHFAGYHMGEDNGWQLDIEEVKRTLYSTRKLGKTVRAMVVINPGNPTGSVLSRESMMKVIQFCADEKIVLFADEVYQTNIYSENAPFVSFRRAAKEMGYVSPYGSLNIPFQLASFHSISKGVTGECGLRGGYIDMLGFPESVKEQVYKLASIKLCSNVPGQIATGLMVNPPQVGDISYPKYREETQGIHQSLSRRAKKLENALNSLPGIDCHPIEGSMYAFPEIQLPERFIQKARELGEQADAFYAMQVLENAGVVIVPGSGFGQRENSWHFRTTFLPPEDDFDEVLDRFSRFHIEFMEKWI